MTIRHADGCEFEEGMEPRCNCDGYHTFRELYEHRINLYITLCKSICHSHYIWKSLKHDDGTMYDGWFLLGINTEPGKQISYHCPIEEWENVYFAESLDSAPKFDGHTSNDVLERLTLLRNGHI